MQSSVPDRVGGLLADVDEVRRRASAGLAETRKADLGQFFTPASVAHLMASMFGTGRRSVRLLDPGAGVGSLTAAWVDILCCQPDRPDKVELTAVELDGSLLPALRTTMDACRAACEGAGIECRTEIRHADFIELSVETLESGFFQRERPAYDLAILNPPYRKLRTESRARQILRRIGADCTNLYAAFLSLVVEQLIEGGEFVAITPRSFCNGPYFRRFRRQLLQSVSLSRLHIFESRLEAFSDDEVLQENVILHARKSAMQDPFVKLTHSAGPNDPEIVSHMVPFEQVVQPHDDESFIHFTLGDHGKAVADAVRGLPCSLADLGLKVSTGRVVDFRAREHLRQEPAAGTAPLLYSVHFSSGRIVWPRLGSRKPNAIVHEDGTAALLLPAGHYVLVKRFSSKEEPRRVVAAVLDPADVPGHWIGIENHLNYFHANGRPIPSLLARGLATFLNSTIVDTYFRQFNGHTQVNATDLRMLRYPNRETLTRIGQEAGSTGCSQEATDKLIEEALLAVVG